MKSEMVQIVTKKKKKCIHRGNLFLNSFLMSPSQLHISTPVLSHQGTSFVLSIFPCPCLYLFDFLSIQGGGCEKYNQDKMNIFFKIHSHLYCYLPHIYSAAVFIQPNYNHPSGLLFIQSQFKIMLKCLAIFKIISIQITCDERFCLDFCDL